MNIDNWNVVPVPEPRSAALVLFGLASLAHRARKRAR
ncbi:MAG: PEP-CTERM sorting domain-containing protein [Deltaproteobacteria bacterium]|nr:MAG: PEP-CTERM sorting domain-containing protein [Deltaproteobacteria bacterium]